MKHMLRVTTKGDRAIVMSRTVEASRQLAFDAWTKPELLKRWLGVHNGWHLEVCEVDLRVGGAYRFVWEGSCNQSMGMGGLYQEVAAPFRIVATERFDESWYPGGATSTTEFLEESPERTTIVQTVVYDSPEALAAVLKTPMQDGVGAGYDQLDLVLSSLAEAAR